MGQIQFMAPWVPAFEAACVAEQASPDDLPFIPFSFATTDKEGLPHARTMAYRGFLFGNKTSNILTFTTDKRMTKYAELFNNDAFEAVFYLRNTRKQFRFRGKARIIDKEHKPVLDLTSVQPAAFLQNNIHNYVAESEDDSDKESVLEIGASHPKLPRKEEVAAEHISCQKTPISHSFISPSLMSKIKLSRADGSYVDFMELSDLVLYPPTDEEYNDEILRQWNCLSKNLKNSFRKPTPGTPLDDANHKLIDSISRGVDGKKEDDGLINFALVALYVDYVDLYELEKDRRYIYEKDLYQTWSELEVCP